MSGSSGRGTLVWKVHTRERERLGSAATSLYTLSTGHLLRNPPNCHRDQLARGTFASGAQRFLSSRFCFCCGRSALAARKRKQISATAPRPLALESGSGDCRQRLMDYRLRLIDDRLPAANYRLRAAEQVALSADCGAQMAAESCRKVAQFHFVAPHLHSLPAGAMTCRPSAGELARRRAQRVSLAS